MNQEISAEISQLMIELHEKLNASIYRVRDSGSEEEFLKYRDDISKVMTIMYFDIMKPIYKEHPDLEPSQLKQG